MTGVYVTGANGFMGSRIVRALLARGHAVTALVGADLDATSLAGLDVELRPFDLLDESSVESALEGGRMLIHNAACYQFWNPDRERIYRVNVEGTRRVLRAAERLGYRRVVYTSSATTLLPAVAGRPGTEEAVYDLRRFHGHYKSSKVMAEAVALRAAAEGLPVVIVNPTTVLGAGDRRPTPTGTIVLHFINGRMKACADTVLDVVDVDDVAEGHVLALERGRVGARYVLGGESLPMLEVTQLLSELTGIPGPRFVIPARAILWLGRLCELWADRVTHRPPLVDVESALHARVNAAFHSDLAQKELGYRPSEARPTLAKAAAWFVRHGYCDERWRRRIEAHGALREWLAA